MPRSRKAAAQWAGEPLAVADNQVGDARVSSRIAARPRQNLVERVEFLVDQDLQRGCVGGVFYQRAAVSRCREAAAN